MQKKPENFSMQDALQFANSPTGQQLIALLKSTDGDAIEQAQQQASQGNYEQAKASLSKVLSSPEVQKLLKEIEKKHE